MENATSPAVPQRRTVRTEAAWPPARSAAMPSTSAMASSAHCLIAAERQGSFRRARNY